MTKKKKIILSISSVLLVLILYGWFFGVQTVCLIGLQFMDRSVIDPVPAPLQMEEVSLPATILEMPGYSFSVPWTNCVQSRIGAGYVRWSCAGSNVAVICEDCAVMDRAFVEECGENSDCKFENPYSCFSYAFDSNIYFMTSADVSFFDSRENAKNKFCMLMCKMAGDSDIFSRVYSFNYNDLKGFQQGSFPKDLMVSLSVFDSQGREWQLMVGAHPAASVVLTQADINTIITTFSVNP